MKVEGAKPGLISAGKRSVVFESLMRAITKKTSCHLLLALCLVSLVSNAQEVEREIVPYPKSVLKVDWLRGTDFSKYHTYAWERTQDTSLDPKWKEHIVGAVDSQLQARKMEKVGIDASPDLIVAYTAGGKIEYSLQGFASNIVVKKGTLLVELADPQTKKAVWWGVAEKILTGNSNKDFRMVEGTISKMFREYPPPGKK